MWVDNRAMRMHFRTSKKKAMDFLMWILVEDDNDRTVVPRYFWGREAEMISLLDQRGVRAEVYRTETGSYVKKIREGR